MFRFLHRDRDEFLEPPSRTKLVGQRLFSAGAFPVLFCFLSCLGLLCGLFTGTAFVPGKFELHLVAYADSPVWFCIVMLFNAIVAVFSAGFIWFRVLGRIWTPPDKQGQVVVFRLEAAGSE